MIVVADATPLNVLARLRLLDYLPNVYPKIIVPPAVISELTRTTTPEEVRAVFSSPPEWIVIQGPSRLDEGPPAGRGEREALAVAVEIRADRILADDRKARRLAIHAGIQPIGTLGLLELFSELRYCALADAIARLPDDFRLSPHLIDAALERERNRTSKSG